MHFKKKKKKTSCCAVMSCQQPESEEGNLIRLVPNLKIQVSHSDIFLLCFFSDCRMDALIINKQVEKW